MQRFFIAYSDLDPIRSQSNRQDPSDNTEKHILNVELPQLAKEAVSHPDAARYDAILVDEGQDYQPLWWNTLRPACKADGEMLLVADATQDIYGTAPAWTDDVMKGAGFPGGRWAQLNVSYRLPPKALKLARKFAKTYLPEEVIDLPEPEQGTLDLYPCHLRWVQCDQESAEKVCSDEILSLMRETGKKSGLANADITVLVPRIMFGSDVVKLLSEYKILTVNTFNQGRSPQTKNGLLHGGCENQGYYTSQLQRLGVSLTRRLCERNIRRCPSLCWHNTLKA